MAAAHPRRVSGGRIGPAGARLHRHRAAARRVDADGGVGGQDRKPVGRLTGAMTTTRPLIRRTLRSPRCPARTRRPAARNAPSGQVRANRAVAVASRSPSSTGAFSRTSSVAAFRRSDALPSTRLMNGGAESVHRGRLGQQRNGPADAEETEGGDDHRVTREHAGAPAAGGSGRPRSRMAGRHLRAYHRRRGREKGSAERSDGAESESRAFGHLRRRGGAG